MQEIFNALENVLLSTKIGVWGVTQILHANPYRVIYPLLLGIDKKLE